MLYHFLKLLSVKKRVKLLLGVSLCVKGCSVQQGSIPVLEPMRHMSLLSLSCQIIFTFAEENNL